jgi:uncharacterized repeat protein (TIGR03899 family)
MEISDLVGLSEPLKKLIEVVSKGVGEISRPYLIKKTADAKAYEVKVISEAIKENQEGLQSIGLSNDQLSLMSLDDLSLRNEQSLEERTIQRVDFKEQKRQRNIENVAQKAIEYMEVETEISGDPVDDDWTTRFFDYAEDISNEEMQDLWARILAGEVKKPKSYSLRTLDTLRNLSTEEAETFIKFASLAIRSSGATFILKSENEKLLEETYNISLGDRLLLEELGLITANDLQFQILESGDSPIKLVFLIGDTIVYQEKLENKPKHQINVQVFTKTGIELLELVKATPD